MLRTRLLAALLGSGVLIVAGIAAAHELVRRRAHENTLRSVLETRVDTIGRDRCEAGLLPPGPGRGRGPSPFGPFGGPGPRGPRPRLERGPIEVFFYGRDYSPRLEGSPPFPAAAKGALPNGAGFVALPAGEGRLAAIGVLGTGWDSERCAFALALLPTPPSLLSTPALGGVALAFLAALAGAIYVAAGSPVRRIRTLADGVRESAASRYQAGVRVEGGDEIADLARAFNEAAATTRAQLLAVEKRERALRDFVAHTTHDVGLPLSVLSGHLSELRERVAAQRPVDAPLVAAAAQEAQYIASLLHNLGAVSRLETEDALSERHPLDLRALVERVALRHAAPARDASVELNHAVPADPVGLVGDVTLLEQAVNNLVHNAIRYNRPGGHVALVLDADAAGFELRVADDGPGVGQDDLPHLGETRFRGGAARSRRPEGMGLGLAIAKAVAARHGLTLSFRRPPAGGFEAVLAGPLPPREPDATHGEGRTGS